MSDSLRPGPPMLAPGLAPGGLIVHVYDRAGVLLMARTLTSLAEARATAEDDADAVLAIAGPGADICMVIYDGDTGARQGPDVLEGPERWRF